MQLAVYHFQTFPPGEGSRLHTKFLKVSYNVSFDTLQAWPGCPDPVRMNPKRDIFGAHNTVIAFGNLPGQHIGKFSANIIKIIVLRGNVYRVLVFGPGAMIDKRKLKGQGTVKIIEERTVAIKNSALVV